MMHKRHSIGRDEAIKLFNSNWWKGKPAREIVGFQLFVIELSMPFGKFYEALEETLNRSVWIYELTHLENIIQEFLGKKSPPTMNDIVELILADKRIITIIQ